MSQKGTETKSLRFICLHPSDPFFFLRFFSEGLTVVQSSGVTGMITFNRQSHYTDTIPAPTSAEATRNLIFDIRMDKQTNHNMKPTF